MTNIRLNLAIFLSKIIALLSKDETTKIGALALNNEGKVLYLGCNALPDGITHDHERINKRPLKYDYMGHAEENIVAQAAKEKLNGATIISTHCPCSCCARLIINSGISKVIIPAPKKTSKDSHISFNSYENAIKMFKEAKVEIIFLEEDCDDKT